VPNEYLQKSYLDRFGRKSVIIRNPYLSLEAKGAKHVFNKNEINIVYTGSVYFAHFDAFKNLIKAIGLVKMPIKLHIFSAQQRKDLENAGVSGKNIEFHKSVDQGRVAAIQRSADILFLPLAFNCPIREVIRTSAPGKIGEYLASGRPILVHAPKDSFISWYFKSRKCGFVVDEPDPKALADAIRQLLNNKILEKDITNEAKKCLQDFSIDKARSNFLSAIYK